MENTIETPSLRSVVWGKFVEFVSHYSFVQIISFVFMSFIAGLLSAAVFNVDETLSVGQAALVWRGGLLVKVAGTFVLVFNARRIASFVWTHLQDMIYFLADSPTPNEITIEGIPHHELLDHLFKTGSLKREEVKDKFGIAHHRFKALADRMEEVGILVRGEANARVLNPEYSRQDVALMLRKAENAEDIQALFRPTDLGFTSAPSAKEIVNRVAKEVDTPLSPALGFTRRQITDMPNPSHVQALSNRVPTLCTTA